jgi:hypothetical protein
VRFPGGKGIQGILFRFPKKLRVTPSTLSIDDDELKFVTQAGTTQINASGDLRKMLADEGADLSAFTVKPRAVLLRIRPRGQNLAGHPGGPACPPKPVHHRLLSFVRLGFHGLGGGKFPIPVWLGARGSRVQFTSLIVGCTTSRTGYG